MADLTDNLFYPSAERILVVYTLRWVGLRSTYIRCRFWQKKNYLFRWSSFWSWRVCYFFFFFCFFSGGEKIIERHCCSATVVWDFNPLKNHLWDSTPLFVLWYYREVFHYRTSPSLLTTTINSTRFQFYEPSSSFSIPASPLQITFRYNANP